MEQLMQGNQAETAKRDEQTMFAFIEEQKQSGLTVKAFCEERQIPPLFFITGIKSTGTGTTLQKIQKLLLPCWTYRIRYQAAYSAS